MAQSEVAQLQEQIALEYEAAKRVFTDFTETGKHAFLTKRQEAIAGHFRELRTYLSPDELRVLIHKL